MPRPQDGSSANRPQGGDMGGFAALDRCGAGEGELSRHGNDALGAKARRHRGSSPEFALELEGAAVRLGERLREWQAKAGAFVLSVEVAVDLAEAR